jgi:hypothetical protein
LTPTLTPVMTPTTTRSGGEDTWATLLAATPSGYVLTYNSQWAGEVLLSLIYMLIFASSFCGTILLSLRGLRHAC